MLGRWLNVSKQLRSRLSSSPSPVPSLPPSLPSARWLNGSCDTGLFTWPRSDPTNPPAWPPLASSSIFLASLPSALTPRRMVGEGTPPRMKAENLAQGE